MGWRASRTLFFLISLVGCSLNYDEGRLADSLAEDIPDMALFQLRQVVVSSDESSIHLTADRSSIYDTRKETDFINFKFYQLSKEKNTQAEGRADAAKVWDSEDADLDGNVQLISHDADDGGTIEGDFFHWEDETKILAARPEAEVKLSRPDGSEVIGRHFSGNFKENSFEFKDKVKGQAVEKDNEDEATS